MSEETRKPVEDLAPLLSRGELMELDTDRLVEKILGLRSDIADDAEEIAALRAALERAEASLATTRDIAQRLRDELAQAKYERAQALAMAVDTTKLMRLRCPKSDGPDHFRIDIHLPLSIDALSRLMKVDRPKAGLLTCACGAEMVVRYG